MRIRRNSFGVKLWLYFVFFAAVIFAVLWLLQTVFLQGFYSGMAINSLKRVTRQLISRHTEDDFLGMLDDTATKNSLLIFVTDEDGEVLYCVDEYSTLYGTAEDENGSSQNPYRSNKESMRWEQGAIRNLPYSHMELIEQLPASGSDIIGYTTSDGRAYVCAARLGSCDLFQDKEVILCISMPLVTVDAAAGILQIQLVWVSILSFVLAFVLAFFLAWRFEKPIHDLACQAARISKGSFERVEKAGFCTELDDLAETLNETTHALARLEKGRQALLAGVSHDLRTPLTMMKGYAEMLRAFSWKDEQTRNHDLMIIEREADRLTALVNEILEYSSIQSNGLKLKLEVFDFSKVVEAVADQFETLWEAQGYGVEKIIEPALRVRGDRKQIERVVYNFLDNAVNHADLQKHIIIRLCAQRDSVRFAVWDSGPGIPEAEIPCIWDAYYTARKRKNKGTVSGLGLSIVKEILDAHRVPYGVACENGCEFWFEMTRQV